MPEELRVEARAPHIERPTVALTTDCGPYGTACDVNRTKRNPAAESPFRLAPRPATDRSLALSRLTTGEIINEHPV